MNDEQNRDYVADAPAIGHNMPPLPALISDAAEKQDFAQIVTEWLNDRFGSAPKMVADLLEECADLVRDKVTGELVEIADDEMKGKVTSLIKRIRDEAKKLEGIHDKEKIPYYRGGQAIDQTFFGLIDKLTRRDKKNRAGAADILNDMLTAYDSKVLAAKQAELRRQAEEKARLEREAREREAAEARKAEEMRLAAERARKPEIVEEKREVAAQQEVVSSVAKAEVQVAAAEAEGAHVAALAKPADLMRTRNETTGVLSTMQTEPYAVVEDANALDPVSLWPFVTLAAKEAALRGWAKTNGYTKQMAGAKVGRRPKSVVR